MLLPKCIFMVYFLLMFGSKTPGATYLRGNLPPSTQHATVDDKHGPYNLKSGDVSDDPKLLPQMDDSSAVGNDYQDLNFLKTKNQNVLNEKRNYPAEKQSDNLPMKNNKGILSKTKAKEHGKFGKMVYSKLFKQPTDDDINQMKKSFHDTSPDVQSDVRNCRDDLCITEDDLYELSGVTPPTASNGRFVCPPGYRKVNRGGVDFCRPYLKNEIDIPKSLVETELMCSENQQLVNTHSGQTCVPKHSVPFNKPECPPGQRSVTSGAKIKCIVMDDHDSIGQKSKSGKKDKGKRRLKKQKKRLSKKERKVSRKKKRRNGWKSSVMPECEAGKVAAMSADGYICLEPVFPTSVCPKDRIPHLTAKGLECVPCPLGQKILQNENLLTCVAMTTVPPPQLTDEPCPEGLIPLQTPVGKVCQYVPPSNPQEATDCPQGQIAHMKDGKMICTSDSYRCPIGQVTIETEMGAVVCGFSTDGSGAECREGEVDIDGECINPSDILPNKGNNPCPPGLQLVTTDSGSMCMYGNKIPTTNTIKGQEHRGIPSDEEDNTLCQDGFVLVTTTSGTVCVDTKKDSRNYGNDLCPPGLELVTTYTGTVCMKAKKREPMDKGNAQHQQQKRCGLGTIPTLTHTGFLCQHTDLPPEGGPACEQGQVLVRVGQLYECLSVYDADTVCRGNERMIRTASGFLCKQSEEVTQNHCSPSEVGVLDENGEHRCTTMEEATAMCGEGYRAVKDGHSFLCKRLRLQLKCPDEFTLSLVGPTPVCVPISDPECLNTGDGGCMGVPEGDIVSPCEEGYLVDTSVEAQGCLLHTEHVPEEMEPDITDRIKPCDKMKDVNGVRPCDLDIELLLAGCNPDCANGGTCNNGTCICPAGITGLACQKDVDECFYLPQNLCEHKCVNTWGSYQCACPDGATLNTDGRSCTDASCTSDCLNNGMCVRGGCRCAVGFEGEYCQTDKDECVVYGARLCQHTCRNTYGGYQCICPPGTRLNIDQRTCTNTTCVPRCRNGGQCENHICHCPDGFYGIICQFDVNECFKQRPCHHTCHNTRGSYTCTCHAGYILDSDGHTCVRN